jgi:hypothetical protein
VNTDIRLYVTFKGHRKRRRLRQLLGDNSTDYIIDLWLTVAQDRPEGVLSGWDDADVALAAGWEGDASVFVKALVSAGFLEQDGGVYRLHGWGEHQPWAVKAKERSEIGRQNANARWDRCKPHANGMQTACNTQCKTDAKRCPSAPSPTPTPIEQSLSIQELVLGGMGETAPDGAPTTEDSREDDALPEMTPLEDELRQLPSWGAFTIDDRAWLETFSRDYPDTIPRDVRDCREHWVAKARKHSRNEWKRRLRTWARRKADFEGGNGHGAKRGLPGNQYGGAFSDITA